MFTYILLEILLPLLDRGLGKVRRDLRRGVVHKLPILAKHAATAIWSGLPLLVWVTVVLRLRLGGCWRRRRSKLRNGGDVLGHGMVEGGRLPIPRTLHRNLEKRSNEKYEWPVYRRCQK